MQADHQLVFKNKLFLWSLNRHTQTNSCHHFIMKDVRFKTCFVTDSEYDIQM